MVKRHDLALLVTLVACFATLMLFFAAESGKLTGEEKPPERYSIQVVLKAKANPPDFWRIVEQGITVAGEEYGALCEVTGPDSEQDVEGQIALAEEAIAKKPDALILAAADYELLAPVCEKAAEAGILVVAVDSDVNFAGRKCFVGTDNYVLGQKLGQLVDSLAGTDAAFGVIGHVEAVTTARERREGLLDGAVNGRERMAAIEYCNSSERLAKEQTLGMLALHPEITCMVGLNESSALGVSRAVRELGLAGTVKVVCCDSSQGMIKMMEDGTIQAFVVQNPFNMGYMSVKNTVALLRGEGAPARVDTESVIVARDGLYKKENQKLLFPFTGAE